MQKVVKRMSDISQHLQQILEARYGRDVRESIYNAIKQCHEDAESGGGGTTDYNNLSNLPQINDVTLKGNKTLDDIGAQSKIIFDASKNGVRTENSGLQNSQSLQSLIDTVSGNGGGSIYIPSGQYQFSSNGTQNIGEHCIKMKSNVIIFGDGASTILKPTGTVQNGLDMFYWNEYADSDSPVYLENCIFRDFMIDGSDQHSTNYTSAGKGFMLNLIKNCHWNNVTVKNMDATGFGVDCPIGCTIKNCEAMNNGKQAQTTDVGASGFGIGFGYSYDESMVISDCLAIGNKKFGIFFEHQRRFSEEGYESTTNRGFLVADCIAKQNYYNYGTEQGINVEYSNCISWNALQHGFFFNNSEQCLAKSCTSYTEGDTSFVILADYTDGGTQENKDNGFFGCISKYCKYGAKIVNGGSSATMQRNVIKDCFLNLEQTNTIMTNGTMDSLFIEGNVSNGAENSFTATVTDFVDKNNSWNSEQSAYELPIMTSTQLGGGKAVEKTDEDVPVAVDPLTGQLFVPTYPENTGGGGGTVDPEQIKQAVNGYLEENPVSGMTAEEKEQLDKNTEAISSLSEDMGKFTTLEVAKLICEILEYCAFTDPSVSTLINQLKEKLNMDPSYPGLQVNLTPYCTFESPAPGITGGDKRIGVKVSYSFEARDTIKLNSPIGDNYRLAVGNNNYGGAWIGGGYLDDSNAHTFSDLDISDGYGKVLLIKRVDEKIIQQEDIDNIKICLVVIKHG